MEPYIGHDTYNWCLQRKKKLDTSWPSAPQTFDHGEVAEDNANADARRKGMPKLPSNGLPKVEAAYSRSKNCRAGDELNPGELECTELSGGPLRQDDSCRPAKRSTKCCKDRQYEHDKAPKITKIGVAM